jgi:hypothetical protein
MTMVTPPTPVHLDHWTGRKVDAWRSRGSGVLYLADVRDNLVLTPAQRAAWPLPRTILKKLTDAARISWFDSVAWDALRGDAPSVSRLQSINSEDAVTWSSFGTLLDADRETRARFLNDLLRLAGVPSAEPNRDCVIEMWKRYPHPDTGRTASGPEADAMLIGDRTVVCIESKWRAGVGTAQGQQKDKTQLEMRAHTVREVATAGGQQSALVLGIVPGGHPVLSSISLWNGQSQGAEVRAVSWEDVVQLAHPQRTVFEAQLVWRRQFL